MKILSFVDIHANQSALKKIKEKSKRADVLVCAGDISLFEEHLEEFVRELNKTGKPVLMIPGNHEIEEDLKAVCSAYDNIYYIHESTYRKDKYIFLGYGGGGFSLRDKRFKRIAKKFEKEIKKGDKVILITHAPPYNTKLDYIGEHVGNITFREFLERVNVHLMICGHLHENFEKEDKIKNTRIINPGPYGKITDLK